MRDEKGNKIDTAPHAQQIIKLKITQNVEPYYILRKKVEE